MIRIDGLSFTYPGSAKPGLSNITLKIEKGDFLAVIGDNGSGKSTLCKAINGLIPHFFDGDYSGTVEVCGLNTAEHKISQLATKVGYVYQDFENQIVRPTVLDDASFACLNYAMKDYEERGLKALKMTGLDKKANEYIWQLSGGQKHLLALAGALALSPEVLILDEPVSQLDPRHARAIYETLKNMNKEYGKTIIVIEHYTDFIAEYCKHVVMIENGRVLWKMETKEALNRVDELQRCHIYPPQVTLAAKCLRDRHVFSEDTQLPVTVNEAQKLFSAVPVYIEDSKNHTGYNRKRADTNFEKEKVISFLEVSMEYPQVKGKNQYVFRDFECNIFKGERVALVGSNGAGKTTMLKLIIGLAKPSYGVVNIFGRSVQSLSWEEISQKISLIYQNPEEMFIMDSIKGDIEYAMKARNVQEYEKRTEELMELFELKDLAHRDGRLLSGGQMRRASLAVGIALNPSILLLDEPTANLDIATRKQITQMLNLLQDKDETILIATHDMQLVTEWATRIIVISDGYIIADGTKEEIFSNRFVYERVGILPPEIYRVGKLISPDIECYSVEEFVNYFIEPKEGIEACRN